MALGEPNFPGLGTGSSPGVVKNQGNNLNHLIGEVKKAWFKGLTKGHQKGRRLEQKAGFNFLLEPKGLILKD